MPAGVHSGVRIHVTLPRRVHDRYAEAATLLGLPRASFMRLVLSEALPVIEALLESAEPDGTLNPERMRSGIASLIAAYMLRSEE